MESSQPYNNSSRPLEATACNNSKNSSSDNSKNFTCDNSKNSKKSEKAENSEKTENFSQDVKENACELAVEVDASAVSDSRSMQEYGNLEGTPPACNNRTDIKQMRLDTDGHGAASDVNTKGASKLSNELKKDNSGGCLSPKQSHDGTIHGCY